MCEFRVEVEDGKEEDPMRKRTLSLNQSKSIRNRQSIFFPVGHRKAAHPLKKNDVGIVAQVESYFALSGGRVSG
jgi:hypothetical protein